METTVFYWVLLPIHRRRTTTAVHETHASARIQAIISFLTVVYKTLINSISKTAKDRRPSLLTTLSDGRRVAVGRT